MNIKKYTKKNENLAKKFTCGNIVIDKFLHDGSALDVNRGITYIMLSDDNNCTNGWMILLIDNLKYFVIFLFLNRLIYRSQ